MTSSNTSQSVQYRLAFVPDALDEWQNLDGSIKQLFKKALKKRLEQPYVQGSALRGDLANCYKIKLLKQGYRLVYTVEDDVLTVLVLSVGKRESMAAYLEAVKRL